MNNVGVKAAGCVASNGMAGSGRLAARDSLAAETASSWGRHQQRCIWAAVGDRHAVSPCNRAAVPCGDTVADLCAISHLYSTPQTTWLRLWPATVVAVFTFAIVRSQIEPMVPNCRIICCFVAFTSCLHTRASPSGRLYQPMARYPSIEHCVNELPPPAPYVWTLASVKGNQLRDHRRCHHGGAVTGPRFRKLRCPLPLANAWLAAHTLAAGPSTTGASELLNSREYPWLLLMRLPPGAATGTVLLPPAGRTDSSHRVICAAYLPHLTAGCRTMS